MHRGPVTVCRWFEHLWQEWRFASPARTDVLRRTCQRCPAIQHTRNTHPSANRGSPR